MAGHNDESTEGLSVNELVRRIREGTLDPKVLSSRTRQTIVATLRISGGIKVSDLAHLLGTSERTIRRDWEHIRKQHAIALTPELLEELMGETEQYTMAIRDHFMRIANSPTTEDHVRVQALFMCFRVQKELIELVGALRMKQRKNLFVHKTEKNNSEALKITPKQKEDEIMQTISNMPPMERDRLRRDLQHKILELAKEETKPTQNNDI